MIIYALRLYNKTTRGIDNEKEHSKIEDTESDSKQHRRNSNEKHREQQQYKTQNRAVVEKG